MFYANKQYVTGDIIKIQSPENSHIHNIFCNCNKVVIIVKKSKYPNQDTPLQLQKSIQYDEHKTWVVWHKNVGHFKLTEDWMQAIND